MGAFKRLEKMKKRTKTQLRSPCSFDIFLSSFTTLCRLLCSILKVSQPLLPRGPVTIIKNLRGQLTQLNFWWSAGIS